MADSDDGSSRQRDSYYNQQRSSFPRSEHSARTPSGSQSRPQSRPQSGRVTAQTLTNIDDYTLQDPSQIPHAQHSDPLPDEPSCPSPAPNVPRIPTRKRGLDKKRRTGSGSGSGSRSRNGSRTGTDLRGRDVEDALFPNTWEGLDEVEGSLPVQNTYDRPTYQHSTLEEERTYSRRSRRQPSGQFSLPSQRSSPILRRGNPGSNIDITALPALGDNPGIPGRSSYSGILTELYAVSHLIFFSILGTLARLGLQWLTFYPGAPITFSEFWANVAGTLVMGFLSEDRRLFQEEWGQSTCTSQNDEEKTPESTDAAGKASHNKVKKTIPLYIGLATGFCGSFTSYSSFIRDIFLAFVNDLPTPVNHTGNSVNSNTSLQRNGGYSFMAGLAVVILTVGVCYVALKVGAHLALLVEPIIPTLPFRPTRRILDPLIVFVAWTAWLGAIFMAIWPPDRPEGPSSRGPWSNETWRGQAIFACVFAPLGCLLRFYLSLALNPLIPSFPLGTFAANIFGTAVLGMAYDLQHVAVGESGVGGGRVGCQVLQGLMDGFCGALTTVSTWTLEIDGLKRKHAYIYGFTSVSVGLLLLVVVMGSVRWTVGWQAVACVH